MSATLKIINNFVLNAQGLDVIGKQGAIADAITDQYSITDVTITGNCHRVANTLATATVVTVYDDDDDVPADWDYLYLWADQNIYVQIIGPTMHVVFKVLAKVPFVLPGFDSIVAAANATLITGGTEPTMSDIDSVVLGNYSGSTANYVFAVID